jgi:hypothetical protein
VSILSVATFRVAVVLLLLPLSLPLFLLPLIRITIQARPSKILSAPNVSTAAEPGKFRNLIGRAVLCGPRFSAFGRLAQMHGEGLAKVSPED